MKQKISLPPFFSLHILGWALFLLFPFFLGVPFREDIFIRFFWNSLFLAVFFYSNSEFLIPKFLIHRKFGIYFSLILIFIIVIVILSYIFHNFLELEIRNLTQNPPRSHHGHPRIKSITRPFFSSIFVFAASTIYKLLQIWFTSEKKKKEIENQALISELSFLKSQVSPHFLFNTLNNIYALSLSGSEKSSEAILKLSQLLRYMLYESENRKVPLEKEEEYLHNYIELQKMRLKEDVKIIFSTEGNITGHFIEPMLLIPFVENAFKHGVNYSQRSWIEITLVVQNNDLLFSVSNSLHKNTVAEKDSGIGLNNVKRRLELLYPGKYSLSVQKTEQEFKVNLKLNLKK
jgi:sensor histidine kinase YesM